MATLDRRAAPPREDPVAVLAGREVIIEAMPWGDAVRVAAIDGATGLEAVIVAPAQAAQGDVERLAAAKLAHQLRKRASPPHAHTTTAAPQRRGRFV